jgi:adenylosuccinate synthase
MAGLNPWQTNVDEFHIYLATRPFPIRVAGNSGPLHGETTWDDLGLPVELTTVTKKPRRVGHWDPDLIRAAVAANGGAPTVRLAVTMFDHVHPDLAGASGKIKIEDLPQAARGHVWSIEKDAGAPVHLLGTGPATMIEVC